MTAMNPTNGSFTVAERVQRHFSCVAVAVPTAAQCSVIFKQIVDGHLSDFSTELLVYVWWRLAALFFFEATTSIERHDRHHLYRWQW